MGVMGRGVADVFFPGRSYEYHVEIIAVAPQNETFDSPEKNTLKAIYEMVAMQR